MKSTKICYNCSMFDERSALKSKKPETIPKLNAYT